MTDHELCLAAAKAAGYTVESDHTGWIKRTGPDGLTAYWEPLKYGAEAFELMVDCWLEVSVLIGFTEVEALGETRVIRVSEEHGTDKHAATRRAIVRAAAAMGES